MSCQYCGDFIEKKDQDEFRRGDVFFMKQEFQDDCDGETWKGNLAKHPDVKAHAMKKLTSERSHARICQICGKSLKDRSGLYRHMRVHSGLKPFKCKVCKQPFARKDHLRTHEANVHSTCKCLYCPYTCNDKRNFRKHLARHSKIGGHSSQKGVVSSKKKVEKKCMGTRALQSGKGKIQKEKCLLCDKAFDSTMKLKVHISLVHRPFQCGICKLRVRTKALLKKHRETHTEASKSRQCGFCGKIFSRKDSVRRHVMRAHSEKLQCIKCKCGKSFNHNWSLASHLKNSCIRNRSSTEKATKDCLFCKRSFVINKRRYDHMATHVDISNGNQDAIASKLRSMLEVRKDHTCNKCGACFSQRLSLCVHQKVHVGQAVFKCEYCKKSFDDYQRLSEHLKTHPEDQRIKCEFCKSYLGNMTSLLRHLRRVHCVHNYCRKKFPGASGSGMHKRSSSVKQDEIKLKLFSINITRYSPLQSICDI